MPDYPRVLHLGFQPIGSPDNTGLTLASMFSEWPEDRLLQVYSREASGDRVRSGGYLLPPNVYPADHAVRRILRSRTPSGVVDGMNTSVRRSQKLRPVDQAKVYATILNDLGPVVLPRQLDTVVRDFRPQVVHTLLGSVRAMNLAVKVAERYELPIVPHYMDDWPANLHASAPWAKLVRARVDSLHQRVLAKSAVGLGIGKKMAEEFEHRYGIRFRSVGNGVAAAEFDASYTVPARQAPYTLRYVGGLHLGRDAVIERIARRLGALPAGSEWNVQLYCPSYSSSVAERLADSTPNIFHMGEIAHSEVLEVLSQATALLFIESEDPGVVPFTRLSVSTKVPEYLSRGKPVLCVGPEEQASIDAFARYGLGTRVSGSDVSSHALEKFLAQATEVARPMNDGALLEEFSTEAIAQRLLAAMRDASTPS